jgi:hypothetical protein
MSSIEDAKLILNNILAQWDHFSTRLQNMKEEELEMDLFSQIDFLSQMDEVRAALSSDIPQLEKHLVEMKEQKDRISLFKKEALQVLQHVKSKLEIAEEYYEEAAEEVLSRCEDRINELIDQILEHRQKTASLKEQIGLEMDEENELRELRDSLEMYREIRLEDIGDETGDPIIDQLDSQMIACDTALLIDESSP